jgi:hypothetical protein
MFASLSKGSSLIAGVQIRLISSIGLNKAQNGLIASYCMQVSLSCSWLDYGAVTITTQQLLNDKSHDSRPAKDIARIHDSILEAKNIAYSISIMSQRQSCDRCRQQKVRCLRVNGQRGHNTPASPYRTSFSQCERCTKAGADCVYSRMCCSNLPIPM